MANRQKGFGMTAEVTNLIQGKYNKERAREAMTWIMKYVKDADLKGVEEASDVQAKLKDGVILCKLINAIEPGSVKKINEKNQAFSHMENIGSFLNACESLGCAKLDLFQTVNLYDGTNMAQVIDGIFALGRKCGQKGLQGIGPKESEKNTREFSEEQLRAGREGHIGLQAGWNKGASQAGQNFGKTRAIID